MRILSIILVGCIAWSCKSSDSLVMSGLFTEAQCDDNQWTVYYTNDEEYHEHWGQNNQSNVIHQFDFSTLDTFEENDCLDMELGKQEGKTVIVNIPAFSPKYPLRSGEGYTVYLRARGNFNSAEIFRVVSAATNTAASNIRVYIGGYLVADELPAQQETTQSSQNYIDVTEGPHEVVVKVVVSNPSSALVSMHLLEAPGERFSLAGNGNIGQVRFGDQLPGTNQKGHLAIDLFNGPWGTSYVAVGDGVVAKIFDSVGDYLQVVVIKHELNGPLETDGRPVVYSAYGHFAKHEDLYVGKVVKRGDVVGTSSYVAAYPPHVHFMMYDQRFYDAGSPRAGPCPMVGCPPLGYLGNIFSSSSRFSGSGGTGHVINPQWFINESPYRYIPK